MATVYVGKDETLESALKRFKRKVQQEGIIADIRRKEFYVKPSVAKREKHKKALEKVMKKKKKAGFNKSWKN